MTITFENGFVQWTLMKNIELYRTILSIIILKRAHGFWVLTVSTAGKPSHTTFGSMGIVSKLAITQTGFLSIDISNT
jgi:hypothetical protein